jgi:alpha/beta superfamily hydrolase
LKVNGKQSQLISGAVGEIELRLSEPTSKKNSWVVICHPHPSFGGSMDNKVVTSLQRSFQSLGYGTIEFNFRGVGESSGEFDDGEGEQDDLVAVVSWLKDNFTVAELILSGFSFGGYIALKKSQNLQADKLCIVAPAVGLYDFNAIQIDISWTLIQGGQDEIVCASEVLEWAMKQPVLPDIYWRSTSSHFFHKQLVWLKQVVSLVF